MWINGLDEIDNKILNLLQKNGRMSYSEVGEEIGLSRTSAKNRIKELEEKGIISGYQAIINPQKTPEMMNFIINVETKAENFESAKLHLSNAKETVIIMQTTGNCHLLMLCVAENMQEIKNFVRNAYNQIEGIVSINTHAVIDLIKGNIITTE